MTIDPTLEVRIADEQDVDAMMALAIMGARENGLSDPNPVKLLEDIWPALQRTSGLMGVIGPRDTRIAQGAILLRIVTPWYTDQEVLEERAIFIHPEHRSAKGGRAARLCEFSKLVALKLDLPLLIGVLSNQRTEAKMRLYKRFFGEPAGAYFIFNARTGGAEREAAD